MENNDTKAHNIMDMKTYNYFREKLQQLVLLTTATKVELDIQRE